MNRFQVAFALLAVLPLVVGMIIGAFGSATDDGECLFAGIILIALGCYAGCPLLDAMSMADGRARYQLVSHPDGSAAWEFVTDKPKENK